MEVKYLLILRHHLVPSLFGAPSWLRQLKTDVLGVPLYPALVQQRIFSIFFRRHERPKMRPQPFSLSKIHYKRAKPVHSANSTYITWLYYEQIIERLICR